MALAAGAVWLVAGIGPKERATLLWHLHQAWPPGGHLASAGTRAAASWTLTAGLLCLYNALGLGLLPWLGVAPVPRSNNEDSPSRIWRLAAPLVVYPLVSLAVLGVAALGLASPGVIAGLLAAFVLTALPQIPPVLAGWREAAGAAWHGAGRPARLALVLGVAWWGVLETPPELDIDCLTYHLAFPQQLLTTHRLPGTDVYSHWAIPLVHECPHVFPLLFGLDESARQLGLALSLLGVLALLAAAAPGLRGGGALAVAITALALPVARYVLATGKNDPVACGYVAAGAGLLLESGALARRVRRWPALAGAGWLIGTATAMKYLMLPLTAALAGLAVYRTAHRGRPRVAGCLAAAAAAPLIPWAAKSWCLLADPLYPVGSVALPGWFGNSGTREQTRRLFEMYLGDIRPKSAVPRETVWLALRNACGLAAGAPAMMTGGVPGLSSLLAATGLGLFGMVFGIRGALDQVERFALPVFVVWNAAGLGALLAATARTRPRARTLTAALVIVSLVAQVRVVAAEWWPGGVWQYHKPATAYLAGRLTADAYRRAGMFGYGRILPVLQREIGAAPRPRAVLAASEILLWDVPARIKTQVFEPPFLWRAAAAAGTPDRISVSFRQANIGWIVHNAGIAAVARFDYTPYLWTPRMLTIYAAWARAHLALLATGEMAVPGYGADELYAVRRLSDPRPSRLLFLPGTEPACAFAALAQLHGVWRDAIPRYRAVHRALPGVVWIDSLLADALLSAPVEAGRTREAYALVRGAVEAGLLDETVLLDWAVTARRLGRPAEAEEALRRAAAAYPLWPERVAAARTRIE